MAKRKCLLTGYETNCTDGCYNCDCGGEVALNDCYVPIYNIQRVCDIVKNMEDVSAEGAEIAEYIRNELEKMVVEIHRENKYITKKDAINALLNKGQHSKRYKLGETWELNLFEIQEAIEQIPVAETECGAKVKED